MAKIAFVFLCLCALIMICTADEANPAINQFEQFGAQLGNVFNNISSLFKNYVDPEVVKNYANQLIDNTKNFVENQKKNQQQN